MNNRIEEHQENTRSRLCETIRLEKEKFIALAEMFYSRQERTEAQCLELTKTMIATIDTVLTSGDWESTSFLRNMIKPLRTLQQQALETQTELLRDQGVIQIEEYPLKENEIKVYISLYQAEGHHMKQWEAQLQSIDSYMAGRPVYKNEMDIQKIVRQKVVQTSEAYAVAVVPLNKILANEFTARKVDRSGHELFVIEVGAITPLDVIEFVHLGKRYHFYKQSLVEKR